MTDAEASPGLIRSVRPYLAIRDTDHLLNVGYETRAIGAGRMRRGRGPLVRTGDGESGQPTYRTYHDQSRSQACQD